MIKQPYNGRARVEHSGTDLIITIPSRKNWFVILFLTAWMGGWAMGELFALGGLFTSDEGFIDLFLLFWLAGWTLGGIFAGGVLLWSLFGKEKITTSKGTLILSRGLGPFTFINKNFHFHEIQNLEINDRESPGILIRGKKSTSSFWNITGGTLRFDYGMKTIKFASGIDLAEARHILDLFTQLGYITTTEGQS